MKNIIYILLFTSILSCDTENSNDCFQTAGTITQIEIELPKFEKIVVHEQIELFITEGSSQKVIIESGENLLSDITAKVINNELVLNDNNNCNFVRKYGLTKIYITSPNLIKIRNASEYNINSIGKLTYQSLHLVSLGEKYEFLPIGDFHLNIENESVTISSNGIATFYLEGSTNHLDINFSGDDTRFEGQKLKSTHIKVRHVSSNDMLIFPIQSLTGSLHSTGDIISYNKPEIIDIEIFGDLGQLLFK